MLKKEIFEFNQLADCNLKKIAASEFTEIRSSLADFQRKFLIKLWIANLENINDPFRNEIVLKFVICEKHVHKRNIYKKNQLIDPYKSLQI